MKGGIARDENMLVELHLNKVKFTSDCLIRHCIYHSINFVVDCNCSRRSWLEEFMIRKELCRQCNDT